jgi:lipopolysaccharide/colanic/teichoic acid biosynthesis glycosyltransferase
VFVIPDRDSHTIGISRSVVVPSPEPHCLTTANVTVSWRWFGSTIKRVFDSAAAVIGLLLFLPIIVIASALLKLDSPGPVLVPQLRYGANRKPFKAYKLRTTVVSSQNWDHQSPHSSLVGRMLRSSGIDDLPKLINVLRGEMSIVGPAPFCNVPSEIDR